MLERSALLESTPGSSPLLRYKDVCKRDLKKAEISPESREFTAGTGGEPALVMELRQLKTI